MVQEIEIVLTLEADVNISKYSIQKAIDSMLRFYDGEGCIEIKSIKEESELYGNS